MKKLAYLIVLAVGMAACSSATAATLGIAGPPSGELGSVTNLSRLSMGLTYQLVEREIEVSHLNFQTLNMRLIAAHLGLDLYDGLTIYGTGGMAERRDDGEPWLDDWDAFYGYGAKFRLLAHDIDGPPLVAGRMTIEANVNYTEYAIGQAGDERKWYELLWYAAIRHELFADYPDGDEPHHYPHSLVFTLGPVFSSLSSDYHARQKWGVMGGVALYATPNIAFSYEIQAYEKITQSLNVGFHF